MAAALNRAAHLALDSPPFVFEDRVGLRLASDPDVLGHAGFVADAADSPRRADEWPFSPRALEAMRGWRGTFVARARFVEDLLLEQIAAGVGQFVILGAGLDTTALRRPELATRLRIFEVDEPGTQAWKRARFAKLDLRVPEHLTFAPVDFESRATWIEQIERVGFARDRRSVVASTGVTQYITEVALLDSMEQIADLPHGTVFACTFMLPATAIAAAERELRARTEAVAAKRNAPWISAYEPAQILALARRAGFAEVRHVSPRDWDASYFAARSDGLRSASSEHMLIALA